MIWFRGNFIFKSSLRECFVWFTSIGYVWMVRSQKDVSDWNWGRGWWVRYVHCCAQYSILVVCFSTNGKQASQEIHSVIHIWWASKASETLSGVTQLKIGDICLYVCFDLYMSFVLWPWHSCVSSVVDPIPNFTKQNPLVYRSLPVSS